MARFARVVVPGGVYHVTHRGNRGAPVFLAPQDREDYKSRLSEAAERYGLEVWAYCLMTNHVHLIAVGSAADSLARAIHGAHGLHARDLNRRMGWRGHLWANRFYSTLLDEPHLWTAVRYVELNPVRAGLVATATDWGWSSARAHARAQQDPLLSPSRPFPAGVPDWSRFLEQGADDDALESIRANTSTGRPTGSPGFVRSLEQVLGRRLRPAPRRRQPPPSPTPQSPRDPSPDSAAPLSVV